MFLRVMERIACWIADLLPYIRGLVGFHAGTADLLHKQSAGLQGDIAKHFRIHAESRPMRKQQIPRILGKLLGSRCRTLPVRGRHDHQLVHVLDVPSALAEFDGEPIKQLGMRWAADP